jgi:hypothetical protein
MYVISFLVNGQWRQPYREIYDTLLGAMTAANEITDATLDHDGWRVLDAEDYTAGKPIENCILAADPRPENW